MRPAIWIKNNRKELTLLGGLLLIILVGAVVLIGHRSEQDMPAVVTTVIPMPTSPAATLPSASGMAPASAADETKRVRLDQLPVVVPVGDAIHNKNGLHFVQLDDRGGVRLYVEMTSACLYTRDQSGRNLVMNKSTAGKPDCDLKYLP
jgi:hypothetical protein